MTHQEPDHTHLRRAVEDGLRLAINAGHLTAPTDDARTAATDLVTSHVSRQHLPHADRARPEPGPVAKTIGTIVAALVVAVAVLALAVVAARLLGALT